MIENKRAMVRSTDGYSEASAIVAVIESRLKRLELHSDKSASSHASQAALAEEIRKSEARLQHLVDGRLAKLLTIFRCTAEDRAVLLTCLAPQFEPRLTSRYLQLTGRQWPTELLAAILFDYGQEPILTPSSAVSVWRLVSSTEQQPGEPPAVTADPAIRGWLSGSLAIEPELQGVLSLTEPHAPLRGWPVQQIADRMHDAVTRGQRAVMVIDGLQGSGRATFAANVARLMDQRCFCVAATGDQGSWNPETILRAHRFALVAGAVLVWRRPDERLLWPHGVWPPPLQAMTVETGDVAPSLDLFAACRITLPVMARAERAALITHVVPSSARWRAETRETLADRRALTPAAIQRMGRIAPVSDEEALEVANASHAVVMGELAQRMHGTLDWNDLVMPPRLKDDLTDLAFECRTRASTWSNPEVRRLFQREAGLVVLFSGPPGTGKTMSAQVIAHELGLDLYRIDCSTVISKYIGETAKNIRSIFARARKIDAVLFFDEADALFSKRTDVKDAHDRHANADTSYLLQLIEGEFEGVAILATNRMADMDPAFLRRIRYVFDFPRPTEQQRREIWNRSARVLIPSRANDMTELWHVLGDCLEITGAQIKTTLLAAHFAAQRRDAPIAASDILRAAEREMAKEGRTIGHREKERIKAHG